MSVNVKSNHSFVPFENFHHYFLLMLKLMLLVMVMVMKVGIGDICEQKRRIFCWSCWLLSYCCCCLEKSLVMTIVVVVHFVVRFVVHILNVFCCCY